MVRTTVLISACSAALALVPQSSAAQTVRGLVVDRATTAPVAGVVLLLLDSAGATISRSLSDERGEFYLIAGRSGAFRIRTMRIGFRPLLSDPMALSANRELFQQITLAGLPLALDTIRVVGRNDCRVRPDSAAITYAIWEQTRAALTAAQLTAELRSLSATIVTFERALDARGRRVVSQHTRLTSGITARPWKSVPMDSLRRHGYVVAHADGGSTYFAPDLDVLLSDAFTQDHCFRLVAEANRLGIAFEPSQARLAKPEIRGTVWVDRATSELRRLEFQYVNLPATHSADAGGELEFIRLANGGWLISHWSIKVPVFGTRITTSTADPRFRTDAQFVRELRVDGGDLAMVTRNGDTLWARPQLTVAGAVVDSVSQSRVSAFEGIVLSASDSQPIPNAEVGFASTKVFTNEQGIFRFVDVPAGTHEVTVRRLGYREAAFSMAFEPGNTIRRRVLLERVALLEAVAVRSSARLQEFEENRRMGLGHFLTREVFEKERNMNLAGILARLPGADVKQSGSWAYMASRRGQGTSLTNQERFCEQLRFEGGRGSGAGPCACYVQVYIDNALVYGGREGETVPNINSLPPSSIEAIEYYAGPSQTPIRYNAVNAQCGVLVIHTREPE